MSSEWSAGGPGWQITWTPDGITGSRHVVTEILVELSRETELAVTPTGPVVPSVPSNSLAVLVALSRASADVRWTDGETPRIAGDFPPGAIY